MPASRTITDDQDPKAADQLLDRVRRELAPLTGHLEEKRMFGGTAFMVDGNMLCCVSRSGLMARVGPEAEAVALTLPAAQPCMMGAGRRMPGFIKVGFDGLRAAALSRWLNLARDHVGALPAKPSRPAAKPPQKSTKTKGGKP